jgi:hypothetical protein
MTVRVKQLLHELPTLPAGERTVCLTSCAERKSIARKLREKWSSAM